MLRLEYSPSVCFYTFSNLLYILLLQYYNPRFPLHQNYFEQNYWLKIILTTPSYYFRSPYFEYYMLAFSFSDFFFLTGFWQVHNEFYYSLRASKILTWFTLYIVVIGEYLMPFLLSEWFIIIHITLQVYW